MQAEDAGIREMSGRPFRQHFDEALRSSENLLEVQGAPAATRGVESDQLCLRGVYAYFVIYFLIQVFACKRGEVSLGGLGDLGLGGQERKSANKQEQNKEK